jgi:hypothetical protein
MGSRLELQSLLETVLESENVYFQPPGSLMMKYPAIVYNRDEIAAEFADNKPYARTLRYQVTVIDKNPDSEIPNKIAALPMCLFGRHFVANNLNHDVFSLYF